PIELELCKGDNTINHLSWEGLYKDLYCPKRTNFKIGGDEFSRKRNSLILRFSKCSGHDYCRPQEEIDAKLDRSSFIMKFGNKYFDFYNITDPVQSYFDSRETYVNSKMLSGLLMTVVRNKYTLNDSLFGMNPTKESEFMSFSKGN